MQLKPGTQLQNGKYRILRTLGQGGFGITYDAEQILLGKEVAIKEFFMKDCCERDTGSDTVTVPTLSNRELVDKFRTKFIREAGMIASMNHPGIVKVLDVFEENGTAYYVMDYLPGGSLADKIKKDGPMNEALALEYIRKIADALSSIHACNTLHLDIKPSNILLDASGAPVLIDFGISKHYDDAGEQTSSTPVGISKGYAPIEQYNQTNIQYFTPATDIYSLGATLLFLLTAHHPPEATLLVETEGPDIPDNISKKTRKAIASAMSYVRTKRPQSVKDFCSLLPERTSLAKDKRRNRSTRIMSVDEEETAIVTTSVKDESIPLNPVQLDLGKRIYLWAYYPWAWSRFHVEGNPSRRLLGIVSPAVILILSFVINYLSFIIFNISSPVFSAYLSSALFIYALVGTLFFKRCTRPIMQYAMLEQKDLSFFRVVSYVSLGTSLLFSVAYMLVSIPIFCSNKRIQNGLVNPDSCKKFIKWAARISSGFGVVIIALFILVLGVLIGIDS